MDGKGFSAAGIMMVLSGLGCSSHTLAATPLNEGGLRRESDFLEQVTPPVVNAVAQDIKKTIADQKNLNQNLAKKHTKQLTQDNLDASVLSENEEQKKLAAPLRDSAYLQQQTQEILPYADKIRLDKLNFSGPQVGNSRGDVTITVNK